MANTYEESIAYMNSVYDALIKKPKLILEVTVESRDQAEELINWLYRTDECGMGVVAELHAIHWDSVAISQTDYDKYLKVLSLMQGN